MTWELWYFGKLVTKGKWSLTRVTRGSTLGILYIIEKQLWLSILEWALCPKLVKRFDNFIKIGAVLTHQILNKFSTSRYLNQNNVFSKRFYNWKIVEHLNIVQACGNYFLVGWGEVEIFFESGVQS